MEFKTDKKSTFHITLGSIFFLISLIWVLDRNLNDLTIRPFDWFYSGIMMINGAINIIQGLGFSFAKLFGKE